MKKYIFRILGFLLFFSVWGIINYCINSYYIQHEILGKGCRTLIIGESHVKSGLNPELFHDADNIAQPAESIILSYYKLKKIHGFHPGKMKHIILSIGHYSISGSKDVRFKSPEFIEEFVRRAYPIMSFRQINSIRVDWRVYTKVFMKNMLLYPRKKHDSYVGHFTSRKKSTKEGKIEDRIKKHFQNSNNDAYSLSETTLHYLDSIMDYCHQNDLKLYTIYIPMQKEYKERIPSFFNAPFDQLKEKFKENNVTLFDFHEIDIGDEYFSDFDHLNGKGADLVTRMLLDEMKKESPFLDF